MREVALFLVQHPELRFASVAAWKAAKPPAERLGRNGSDTALEAHVHVPQLAAAAFPGAAAAARFFFQGARAEGGGAPRWMGCHRRPCWTR